MEYRRLGSTGTEVSCLSLGGWATFGDKLDSRVTTNLLAAAFDLGINFFDNAETYGNGASESMVGAALKNLRWPRETYLISSKVYWGTHGKRPNTWGLSRKHIFDACHAALRRYGVDYIDFFLCHRYDPAIPVTEIVRAMSDLVRQGKIMYWGSSEWPADQLISACEVAAEWKCAPPQIEQMQYSLLFPKHAAQAARSLAAHGIGMTTWSPLAHGLLAGRSTDAGCRVYGESYGWLRETLFQPDRESVMLRISALEAIAREIGLTPSRFALAWVLQNPDICTSIMGASSVEQLRENVSAIAARKALSSELMRKLQEIVSGADAEMPS